MFINFNLFAGKSPVSNEMITSLNQADLTVKEIETIIELLVNKQSSSNWTKVSLKLWTKYQ